MRFNESDRPVHIQQVLQDLAYCVSVFEDLTILKIWVCVLRYTLLVYLFICQVTVLCFILCSVLFSCILFFYKATYNKQQVIAWI